MRFVYPYETAAEGDSIIVSFPDVPGALTQIDPDEDFDAARFSRAAREIAVAIDRRGAVPIVAGGTGLYIKAMLYGLFRAEPPDPLTRQRLRQEAAAVGSEALHRRLAEIDAKAAGRIHPHDTFRIIRALETAAATGEPITNHHRQIGRAHV